MEQLSPEVRQKVVKMSEARLWQKLVQAGYREVDISTSLRSACTDRLEVPYFKLSTITSHHKSYSAQSYRLKIDRLCPFVHYNVNVNIKTNCQMLSGTDVS